ncbi:LADA_0D09120g1_1 [Lachancea dasiensis]|uniref:LADA_0D09120g1_1 n=1 Tax=Lachancea dasiensis TaxID=1072105 RepID=A0A1G4J771_9SACH|nr:LADA_0D09120g1_1 [Lachancea dasiensis]
MLSRRVHKNGLTAIHQASIEMADVTTNSLTYFEGKQKPLQGTVEVETGVLDIATVESIDIDEKKLLRKMDMHIIPGICILYLLSFIDRGNIGNAKIEGMPDDLKLHGNQWNIVLTVFYFSYCAFQVPYNMLMSKYRPSILLPTTMVLWGIVVTLTGLVKTYKQLIACRVLLGLAESGLVPGIVFYLTKWYTRQNLQYREALFFAAASGAGAFSGLLAYGISFMDGLGGISGWRWIFIIEGIVTVVLSGLIYFITYDYPETAKFLTDNERRYIKYRLTHDFDLRLNVSPEVALEAYQRQDKSQITAALCDWQLWLQIFIQWCFCTALYTAAFFLPSIVKSLGYTNAKAQLLTVPPYAFSIGSSLLMSYYSDKLGLRSPFIFFCQILMIVGYIVALTVDLKEKPGAVYAGIFLTVVGTYSAFPGMLSWLPVNVDGPYKRSISVALHVGFGQMGSTFATNYFRLTDAPRYRLGYSMSIMFVGLGMLAVVVLNIRYYLLNKEKERSIISGETDSMTDVEILAMGDRSPYFRYQH